MVMRLDYILYSSGSDLKMLRLSARNGKGSVRQECCVGKRNCCCAVLTAECLFSTLFCRLSLWSEKCSRAEAGRGDQCHYCWLDFSALGCGIAFNASRTLTPGYERLNALLCM